MALMSPHNSIHNSDRKKALATRSRIEQGIRSYFARHGVTEVRTPLLVPSPGLELHLRPMEVQSPLAWSPDHRQFLPTSPELAMKKLLAAGAGSIFQITPAFRNEPRSKTHSPEFTMLEWYRVGFSLTELRQETETLIRTLVGQESISYQGQKIQMTQPWPVKTVRQLFREWTGIDLTPDLPINTLSTYCREKKFYGKLSDLENESWDDLFFRIWMNGVEPNFPKDRPLFVTDFPPSQAALAQIKKDQEGHSWAQRFEVFIGGLELGNAYDELSDAAEQKRRFESDLVRRQKVLGQASMNLPIDHDFISALQNGFPQCAGIAMGVDRLVMLLADVDDIQKTFWIAP